MVPAMENGKTNAQLREELRELLLHPPKGWGEFSLARSVQFKNTCAKARRASEGVNTARPKLIELIQEMRSFY
jgi:hypothetical protein